MKELNVAIGIELMNDGFAELKGEFF